MAMVAKEEISFYELIRLEWLMMADLRKMLAVPSFSKTRKTNATVKILKKLWEEGKAS